MVNNNGDLIDGCFSQDYVKIETALNNGATINCYEAGRKGTFPLHIAAEHKDFRMIRLLIENNKGKYDLEQFNTRSDHATALLVAVMNDSYDIAEYLLKKGAWVDTYDYSDNDYYENIEFYEPDAGFDDDEDIIAQRPKKQTAMYYACKNRNAKMVSLLLRYGAVYGYLSKLTDENL